MIKIIFLLCFASWIFAANAQSSEAGTSPVTSAAKSSDAERARINAERTALEAVFRQESAACYKKFLVNECLGGIKLGRQEGLADLRRQEIGLNTLDRRAKGAGQIKRTEEKSSPEKQQQEAEKRASALKDFQARKDREKQKNGDRADAHLKAQTNIEALAKRTNGNSDKAAARSSKQAAAAEEVRKFNERQQNAQQRQAQHDRDQLNQPKVVQPLPVPE